MDLSLLHFGDDGTVTFDLTDSPHKATGIEALIQSVLVELLSTPFRGRGSGLTQIIETATLGEEAIRRLDITEAVLMTKTHLLTNQREQNLPAGELLKDLTVHSLVQLSTTHEWALELNITNANGDTFVQSLSL